MTKKDLQKLLDQTDDSLAKLSVQDVHITENLTAQRDDSLQRVADLEEKNLTLSRANDQLKAVIDRQQGDFQAILQKATAELVAEMTTLRAENTEMLSVLGGFEAGQELLRKKEANKLQELIDAAQERLAELKKPKK